jgi:hypothetical protein
MPEESQTGLDPTSEAEVALADAINRLQAILDGVCRQLDPFPSFLGMATIQAVELEPTSVHLPDRGCVVVTPDGAIAELDVTAIPGVVGVLEVDQVEQFKPLELEAEEFVIYLMCAIRTLGREARRRGR